jgi:glyoxylase-like metal-dependent hydrolase (beta-lactamase superfamily II)
VYPDRVLLLDCGCICDAPKIDRYIDQQLGMPRSALRLGVASHAHPDHMGGARALRENHGFRIAAPPGINEWYRGVSGSIQHWVDIQLAQYVARSNRIPSQDLRYQKTIVADQTLVDGQPLSEFADWRVFFTPGHTHHDIVLYNPDAALLYASDVIVRVGSKYILPIPMILREEMWTSYEKIRRLAVKRLALAHQGLHDVKSFEALIQGLQQQLQEDSGTLLYKMVTVSQYFSPALRRTKKYGLPKELRSRDIDG